MPAVGEFLSGSMKYKAFDAFIIVDIYCPTIYDYIENVAKKVDMSDYRGEDLYEPIIMMSAYIKDILIRDEENPEQYNQFDDVLSIIEIIYNMDDDILNTVQQCISDSVFDYSYRYGFKADTVICPHCSHAFTEDVETGVRRLLFLQAQHHMTNV